jgi:hypothetical protein
MSHVNMKQVRDAYDSWCAQGPETKSSLVGLLPDDWSFEGKRVLDFGCGDGRTLREFLPEAEHREFWGADIDAPSITRLEEALCPPVHAGVRSTRLSDWTTARSIWPEPSRSLRTWPTTRSHGCWSCIACSDPAGC